MSVSCKYWALFVCILTSFPLFSQTSFFQRSFRYLELNLNGTGGQTGNPFAGSNQSLDIFRVIERAAKDKKINGIVLNISDVSGSLDTSRAFLWEIRNALEQFKSSGKKICAFISNADIDVYFLASIADKIVMDELGTLSMLGYSVNRSYVQHSLEKLGIGVRELRYLEYKSASETFSRDSMSEADRRQYSEYLDDIFNLTRNTLKITRNWTDEEFDAVINRDFLYSAKSAQNRNLVDRVGRKDAVLEALKELEGAEVRQFSLYGSVSSSLLGENSIYKPPGNGGIFRRPPIIAVVYASGQTDMERGMEALNLSMTIRELADKTRVKAIVIKIDALLAPKKLAGQKFDIIFLDPPYFEEGFVEKVLYEICDEDILEDSGYIILEMSRTIMPPEVDSLRVFNEREYSGTRLVFMEKSLCEEESI